MTNARRKASRATKVAKRKGELRAPKKKYTVAERNAAIETAKTMSSIIPELVEEALGCLFFFYYSPPALDADEIFSRRSTATAA